MNMVSLGIPAQTARSVLPNSLKTEIVMTANFREWLHFLELRTSVKAHPMMIEIAHKAGYLLHNIAPTVFSHYNY